jgi:uncharacterized protein (AIM24 family)
VAEKYLSHLMRGGELLRADRVDEARAELEAARDLRPGDSKALSLLGLCYFRLGRYEPAKAVYAELVKAQPKDASLRLNLGLVHLKLGETLAAVNELSAARDLDPSQNRTIGYLGLAYARSGQYKRAREAFLAAGQDDLAREMEQYLAPEDGGRTAKASTPPPIPADARPAREPELEAVSAAEPEVEDVHNSPTARFSVSEVVAESNRWGGDVAEPHGEGIVSAAVRIATPRASMAQLTTGADGGELEASAPQPLSMFATSRLLRPDDGELPFELGAGDTLIVRVRGRLISRTAGVIVSGGELSYEPATQRVRGRSTDDAFGDEDRPMFVVAGEGHLCASASGGKFAVVELADDALYLREDLVFAFEDRLRWENGHVPGGGDQLPVVQFRGEGCVALRTRRAPITVKLAPEKVLYVEAALLAGWIGRVVPRVVAPAGGEAASAPFVECSGEGVLIVEEP